MKRLPRLSQWRKFVRESNPIEVHSSTYSGYHCTNRPVHITLSKWGKGYEVDVGRPSGFHNKSKFSTKAKANTFLQQAKKYYI